ncbi:MAG: leucyl aminopeptidase [Mariprofundus sp.]|nr:leucyl aminopeptidase [Mariprofundus sp.]
MIEISVKAGHAHKQRDDAVVLPLLNGRNLTKSSKILQQVSGKVLPAFLRKYDSTGTFGESHTLYDVEGIFTQRVMLLDVGDEKKLNLHKLRVLAAKAVRKLAQGGARDVSLFLQELAIRGTTLSDKVQAIAEGVLLGLYQFDKYQKSNESNKRKLRSVTIMIASRRDLNRAECAVTRARAIAAGTNFARDLANEPGNVCTPEYLGQQAASLSHPRLHVTVMDKQAIKTTGLNALLAVNQGSAKEPRFIVLEYQGGIEGDAPVALVGKGLTFDAGGISIKPGPQMEEMKFDMCGSAAVLGIFKAVIEMNLPVNLLGVIPSTENLLGASAYKPGDIIRGYKKDISIEIQNTDAEGRIILSDALAYAAERKPSEIIDFATLTGACVIALGAHASGLMGTGKKLKKELIASGDFTHDRVWELPMHEEYQEQIKSDIDDIRNIGGREAGTITAACFLSRFVGDIPWAHLDIAGTAWNMKGTDLSAKGATGAGVRLVLNYLMNKVSRVR